jgi:collagenase-like PrtC family protease
MKKFSLGFNFEPDFLSSIKKYVSHISSIYFPIPLRFLGSGRTINEPKYYDEHVKSIIKFCKEFNIKSLILINPTCEGVNFGDEESMMRIVDYICGLEGLSGVVSVNPIYMKLLKKKKPKLEIQASVNCYIKTVEHARYFKDFCDVITTDRDINRDIKLLKKINKILPVKVLINEGCLGHCPYRNVHYNGLSHSFEAGVEKSLDNIKFFIDNACVSVYKKEPWKFFLIPFIRPEDIMRYEFAQEWKISTRVLSTKNVIKVLKAYIDGKSTPNLLDILDTHGMKSVIKSIDSSKIPMDFFIKISKCGNECDDCHYCKELFKEVGEVYRSFN